ncbi:MAG TPA: PaaI family thioesterase [Candidatus Thermoplasmatota archaeon]|nr:PaaI family thioesterase [Candidatus Thermoplasmatota archaeon]
MTDADVIATLDDLIRIPPFHAYLGVEVVRAAPGLAVLRIPPKEEFVGNPLVPAVHGGIIAALVDLAGGAALFIETQIPTPTIDMRVDYLRPAIAGRPLIAEARVASSGKHVAFVDVDVKDDQDRLVARGRCVYSVKDRASPPPGRAYPIG